VRNVLVTGGAGYIGSHTAKALARAGSQPIVLDNLITGNDWAVQWGPFVRGNIGDRALVRKVIAEYRVEAVIHFAAHAYVGESTLEPRKYFENNVANTLALLDAVRDSGVEQFVFSSTCATYGVPRKLPIREEHAQLPVNPYGESKLFIEKVLGWYREAYGLRSVCLRYFNAAGADPECEIGECHTPETHLIPLVIYTALGLTPAVTVFGTDYPTPDGTAVRDYIHVCDLAEAHVRALDYLYRGGPSTAVNLGIGTGHSVRDVVRAVERVAGRKLAVSENPRRFGDPAILVASAEKARKRLGWVPRFTSLDQIVETAWAWHLGQAQAPALSAAV
jgi:UDP-arabinose 4-epimerase